MTDDNPTPTEEVFVRVAMRCNLDKINISESCGAIFIFTRCGRMIEWRPAVAIDFRKMLRDGFIETDSDCYVPFSSVSYLYYERIPGLPEGDE